MVRFYSTCKNRQESRIDVKFRITVAILRNLSGRDRCEISFKWLRRLLIPLVSCSRFRRWRNKIWFVRWRTGIQNYYKVAECHRIHLSAHLFYLGDLRSSTPHLNLCYPGGDDCGDWLRDHGGIASPLHASNVPSEDVLEVCAALSANGIGPRAGVAVGERSPSAP